MSVAKYLIAFSCVLLTSLVLVEPPENTFADFACLARRDELGGINNYKYLSDAVCRILIPIEGGDEYVTASGVLVNNTNSDGKMYVLTSAHILDAEALLGLERRTDWHNNIEKIQTHLRSSTINFFFRKETCNGEVMMPKSDILTYKGATLKAIYYDDGSDQLIAQADIMLLELRDAVDKTKEKRLKKNLYFAGWDVTETGGFDLSSNDDDEENTYFQYFQLFSTGSIVSHPAAYPQKIAFPETIPSKVSREITRTEEGVIDTSWVEAEENYSRWKIDSFYPFEGQSAVSNGSSGAPIYNPTGRVYALVTYGGEPDDLSDGDSNDEEDDNDDDGSDEGDGSDDGNDDDSSDNDDDDDDGSDEGDGSDDGDDDDSSDNDDDDDSDGGYDGDDDGDDDDDDSDEGDGSDGGYDGDDDDDDSDDDSRLSSENEYASSLHLVWNNGIQSSLPLKNFLDPDNTGALNLEGGYLCNRTQESDDQKRPAKKPRIDHQNLRRTLSITEDIPGTQMGTLAALKNIEGEGATIKSGADIELIAGDYTEFKTGFTVEKGSRLLVETGESRGVGCINICTDIYNEDTYSIKGGEVYGHVSGADSVETFFTVGGNVYTTGTKPITGENARLLDVHRAFGNAGVGIYNVKAHYTNSCDQLTVNYEVIITAKDIEESVSDYQAYAEELLDVGNYLDRKAVLATSYLTVEGYAPDAPDIIPEEVLFKIDSLTDVPYALAHGFEWSFRSNDTYGGRGFFNTAIVTSEFEVQEKLTLGTLQRDTLKMDVYYPKLRTGNSISAAPALPLVIYLFGGGFVKNANPDLGKEVCKWLAAKGYVVAAIDYRIGMDPLEGELAKRAVIRAWQDMEAAVKYWRIKSWNFSPDSPWKIDPQKIYGLGWSAGGITVLHNQYLTRAEYQVARSDQFNFLWTTTAHYEVHDGDLTYTTYDLEQYPTMPCIAFTGTPCTLSLADSTLASQTDGVANKSVSFAGAIGVDRWMQHSTRPVADIHHSHDRVVSIDHKAPFTYLGSLVGAFDVLNGAPRLHPMYGGRSMEKYARLNQIDNFNLLQLDDLTMAGGVGLLENYHFPQVRFGSIMSQVRNYPEVEPKIMFYVDAFFTGAESSGASDANRVSANTGVSTDKAADLPASQNNAGVIIYPNPASDDIIHVKLTAETAGDLLLTLRDMQGRTLLKHHHRLRTTGLHIIPVEIAGINNGLYMLEMEGQTINYAAKISIVR